MNIDEFIAGKHRNGYLAEEGWNVLYCRNSTRYFDRGKGPEKTKAFDLANIGSSKPGSGTLKRLLLRLRRDYPHLAIYVECVQPPKLHEGLRRMGFSPTGEDNYVLMPESPLLIEEESLVTN